MNIKISIAEIIISFEFSYRPFEKEFKKILKKFIVKTDKSDINIKLIRTKSYKIINNDISYFKKDIINDEIATLLKWDINGELNLNLNTGIFHVYRKKPDFLTILKFILLNFIPQFNALLLHSSSIAINNNFAVVGSGISGSGKSTFAKKLESEGGIIIHDEITLVRKVNNSFYVYPTPFNYNPKHIVNFLEPQKLKSIFFLKQSKDKYIKDISLKNFYKEIFKVIFSNKKMKTKNYELVINIIEDLYNDVKIKELSFDLSKKIIETLNT